MLQEFIKSGDTDSAYQLFTPKFKTERAPTLDDFKTRLKEDGSLIVLGRIRKMEEEYDSARAIIQYGNRFIYVHFVVVDEIEPAGKVWQIATPDEYGAVEKASSPKKTLFEARAKLISQKDADIVEFMTPAAATEQEYVQIITAVLKYYWPRTKSGGFRSTANWAAWQRMIAVDGQTRAVVFKFVNRSGKWLICTDAEFEQAVRLYGED